MKLSLPNRRTSFVYAGNTSFRKNHTYATHTCTHTPHCQEVKEGIRIVSRASRCSWQQAQRYIGRKTSRIPPIVSRVSRCACNRLVKYNATSPAKLANKSWDPGMIIDYGTIDTKLLFQITKLFTPKDLSNKNFF